MTNLQYGMIMALLTSVAVYSGWSACTLTTLSTKVRALEDMVRSMRK